MAEPGLRLGCFPQGSRQAGQFRESLTATLAGPESPHCETGAAPRGLDLRKGGSKAVPATTQDDEGGVSG